jgi:glutathione-independent formaldehyde dehydrogenase
MGGWPGGQSEYAVVPYADFNLLRIPDKAAAMDKLLDIAYLSDILPTSYYGAMGAGVTTGSSVYIAGAGPVGLCAAACCLQLLGAGPVIVGDYNEARLKQARNMGCETVLLEPPSEKSITGAVKTALLGGSPLTDKIQSVTGDKYVDCAIDCAGFETNGLRRHSPEDRSSALNDTFTAVKFGGKIGVPGLYPLQDTGADDAYGKKGGQQLDFGKFWNKGAQMTTGQCPVSRYNRYLLDAILAGKLHVAEYLNTTVISLDEAPKAYKMFDEGIARKFVIDPHGMIPEKAKRNAKALSLDA